MSKILIAIFVCSAFVFAFGFFSKANAYEESWRNCSTDSDCIKTGGVCGNSTSINLIYKSAYDAYISKASEVASCAELLPEQIKMGEEAFSACIEKKCTLRFKKL